MTLRQLDAEERKMVGGLYLSDNGRDDERRVVAIRDADLRVHGAVGRTPEVLSTIHVLISRLLTHEIEFAGCDDDITDNPRFKAIWAGFVSDLVRNMVVYGFCAVYLNPKDVECPRVIEWEEYRWSVVKGGPTDAHEYRLIPRRSNSAYGIMGMAEQETPETNPHVFVVEFKKPKIGVDSDKVLLTSQVSSLVGRYALMTGFMKSWSSAVAGSSVPTVLARSDTIQPTGTGINEAVKDAVLSNAKSRTFVKETGARNNAPSMMSLDTNTEVDGGDVITTSAPISSDVMSAIWDDASVEVGSGKLNIVDVPENVTIQNAPQTRVPIGFAEVRSHFAGETAGVTGVPAHSTAGGTGDGGPAHEAAAFMDNLVMQSAVQTMKHRLDHIATMVYLKMFVEVDGDADDPLLALTGLKKRKRKPPPEPKQKQDKDKDKDDKKTKTDTDADVVTDAQARIDKVRVRLIPTTTTAAVLKLLSMGVMKWDAAKELLADTTGLDANKFVDIDPFAPAPAPEKKEDDAGANADGNPEAERDAKRKKIDGKVAMVDKAQKTDPSEATSGMGGQAMGTQKTGNLTV